MKRALTGFSSSDLERLASGLETGRLGSPVSAEGLMSLGLGHLVPAMAPYADFEARALRAVVEVALAERAANERPRNELVWSGPEARVSAARDTSVVVAELFRRAENHVMIAGYRFDRPDILEPLHTAMQTRGVRADLFLDVEVDYNERALRSTDFVRASVSKFFDHAWTFGSPRPNIYTDARAESPLADWASIHAKCIVVDERWSLVTSANFTDRGQTRNIEVGALLDDKDFAHALVGQWNRLIGEALVRPYVA
ncbi:MAG: DISARM system phospholipase D-like protein DrmC [Polyangiaceae bacterium]